MAPAVSTGVNTPDIWTKLYHYGYNATNGLWADDYFQKFAQDNRGHHFITIPDVPAGDYLIRCKSVLPSNILYYGPNEFVFQAEIITLQEASHLNGAQHYPSCVQVRVTSNGSEVLPGGVSFPGRRFLSSTL